MNQRPVAKKIGPYICHKVIDSESQSAVFLAEHGDTGRKVVLRAMSVTVKDVDQALEQCMEVLEEMSAIHAPNLVEIEDYGADQSTLYIAMSVMSGGTLLERMNQRLLEDPSPENLPSPGDILYLVYRIGEALDTIHDAGMVHGQISPRSIMFNDQGEAFLADIGLTRLMKILYRLESTNSFNMNKYSAPELWEGERPMPATDQYALACIIYELLTGRAPFDSTSIVGLMQAHSSEVVTPPHYIRDDLPGDLSLVFWQALAKPVDRRFSSIEEFYTELEKNLDQMSDFKTDFFTFKLD